MWYQNMMSGGWGLPSLVADYAPMLLLLIIWSIIWKGMALWRAARLGNQAWFVILLIVNTFGILEIVYLFVVTKRAKSSPDVTPAAQ